MLAPSAKMNAPTSAAHQVGLRSLYPFSVAFRNGTLAVDQLHTLYYEEHGRVHDNDAQAQEKEEPLHALFLHGGPGAGCFPNHARLRL